MIKQINNEAEGDKHDDTMEKSSHYHQDGLLVSRTSPVVDAELEVQQAADAIPVHKDIVVV